MTQTDAAKLTALIPELESWTGGERRDLDAKIAEVRGWVYVKWHSGNYYRDPIDGVGKDVPHYLGTAPTIATEDTQRLVNESGAKWCRDPEDREDHLFCVSFSDKNIWFHDGEFGASLLLAWARAVVAKGEQK